MRRGGRAIAGVVALAAASGLVPGRAVAQRAGENAVTSSDDAFGTNIGFESTGIYTEFDTRGFSPTKAGNVRIDGIYFDPVAITAGRLRERTAIRVGFAAEDYPFHAPTGIVDHKFRDFPTKLGMSVAWHQQAYGAWIGELDLRVPVVKEHFSLTGGLAMSHQVQADGSGNRGYGLTLRPILRFSGIEFAPFVSAGGFKNVRARPLLIASGSTLPALPAAGEYFGQTWAIGKAKTLNAGGTIKAALASGLLLRAGMFHSANNRLRNYSEIFTLQPQQLASQLVTHRLIADPRQDVHSTSGEAQLAWRFTSGKWQHRLIAGYRYRDRFTETGGSVALTSPNAITYGTKDPLAEPAFAFGPVNSSDVKQSSIMLGYTGKLPGLASINMGLQKARYRGTSHDGLSGEIKPTRDDPWLYNVSLGFDLAPHLSVYVGTEKGLEDSGTAPESALNRNDQLPPTRTTQYEGGVRWKFHGGQSLSGQWVINAFQIEKPYFTFDPAGNFVQLGQVHHRGIETSLSGQFGKRLNVVAGAVAMQPRVSTGGRPVGTPSLYARADFNYHTDILGGLTPTASFTYTSSRLVSSRLEVPGFATVDLGVRHVFRVGATHASIRAVAQNVFDAASWKVVAANTLYPEERRRFTISLTADF